MCHHAHTAVPRAQSAQRDQEDEGRDGRYPCETHARLPRGAGLVVLAELFGILRFGGGRCRGVAYGGASVGIVAECVAADDLYPAEWIYICYDGPGCAYNLSFSSKKSPSLK